MKFRLILRYVHELLIKLYLRVVLKVHCQAISPGQGQLRRSFLRRQTIPARSPTAKYMATASSSHTAFQFFRPAKRRLTCECLNRHRSPLQPAPSSRRNVSNATPHFSEMEVE